MLYCMWLLKPTWSRDTVSVITWSVLLTVVVAFFAVHLRAYQAIGAMSLPGW